MATPSPVFPGAVATDAQLMVANNQIRTTLTVTLTPAATQIWVNSAAGFVPNSLISIDNEIIAISGVLTTPSPALVVASGGRGWDATTAASHQAGAAVAMLIVAWHHNALSAEVKAIEASLGPNLLNVGASGPYCMAAQFNFAPLSPGGALTAGVANVITLSPVPKGVNGTDANHYVYISGGTGTAESVLIAGGTAVAGASSGTIIVTPAGAHSGAWTLKSATAGIQEAIQNGCGLPISLPTGNVKLYAPVTVMPGIKIVGQGRTDAGTGTLGTTIDATAITSDYAFKYASALQTTPYQMGGAFQFTDFTMNCGFGGIRINSETALHNPAAGASNQAYLIDNVYIARLNLFGNNSYTTDPTYGTTTPPTLAAMRAYGTGISLNLVFRARIEDCVLGSGFGIGLYAYGDENLMVGGGAAANGILIYLFGSDSTGYPAFGNENIIEHVKIASNGMIGTVWLDTCGGAYIHHCYFEPHNGQYLRVLNSANVMMHDNWVQAYPDWTGTTASTVPAFHVEVSAEALIYNNTYLQGSVTVPGIELSYAKYQSKYPNFVRMWNNGSYFPQPKNRTFLGSGNYSTYPEVPGVLVGPVNPLVWNAFNNPGEYSQDGNIMPFAVDPVTGRWAFKDATGAGVGSYMKCYDRTYRTFLVRVAARSTGAGTVYVTVVYVGNATTTLFGANLTFTTTSEVSTQSTPNLAIPATETLKGYFSVGFTTSGAALVEELELVPVS